MSILSTNKRLIKVGTEYSAGSGISIDDHVISVTGEFGKTYSAGDNVSIYEQDEHLYISSKDWSDDIANASANAYNEATAQIPDPFDPSYLSAQIDNKLNSSDFTTWQNGQYTTDLQTIEGQINNKLDTSSFSDVSGSFLTAINIPESATWNEVSQAYEQASGTYLTSVSIPESATWNEVSTTVQSNSAQWAEGGTGGDEEVNSFVYDNSATIVDVDTTYQQNSATYLTSHQDISYKLDTTAFSTVSGDFLTAAPADMATTGDVAELAQTISETYQVKGDYLTTADSANFYPTNNPSGFITGVDLSNYYTKDETSGKEELADAFANVPTPDYEVESYIHNNSASIDGTSTVVQSNSSTWSDVTAYQSNSASYLTAHQSLEGYATTAWVDEQGYITEVNIPESATWNEVSTTVQSNSSTWDNVTNKLDTTSFSDVSGTFLTAVDLTPYQTIEGMTAYQPVGSYATTNELEQVSADITATIPSTAGLASESYVQTNSAVLTGMIDGKQDTLTFGYDEQDRISSINNSALAGGGDVPEDVMVEPNLEYNAVNEISAYNGSAIAQYGAEKQWLVHDDTLVHAANSAQYALGVNLSAVAQLLGVDETVLYSGSPSWKDKVSLSESPLNFSRIKVLFGNNLEQTATLEKLMGYTEFVPFAQNNYLYMDGVLRGNSREWHAVSLWSGISGTNWKTVSGQIYGLGAATANANNSYCSPYLILGIGRKS